MPKSIETPNTQIKRAIPIMDEDMSGTICTLTEPPVGIFLVMKKGHRIFVKKDLTKALNNLQTCQNPAGNKTADVKY